MPSSVQILPKSGRPVTTYENLEGLLAPHKDALQDYALSIVGIGLEK